MAQIVDSWNVVIGACSAAFKKIAELGIGIAGGRLLDE